LRRDGILQSGVSVQHHGCKHRIDFQALIGMQTLVYGQTELNQDLIEARLASTAPIALGV